MKSDLKVSIHMIRKLMIFSLKVLFPCYQKKKKKKQKSPGSLSLRIRLSEYPFVRK